MSETTARKLYRRLLTERGASVVLVDLPSSAGKDAAVRLGPSASFAAADVTDTPGDLDAFAEVIRINLIGTYNMLRLAAARMSGNEPLDGDRGAMVLTASVAAFENPYLNGQTIRLDGSIRMAPR